MYAYICYNEHGNPERARAWLLLHSYKPIDASITLNLTELPKEKAINVDYSILDACDCIYMVDGWQRDAECVAKLNYAKNRGKKVLYERHFKEFRKHKEQTICAE